MIAAKTGAEHLRLCQYNTSNQCAQVAYEVPLYFFTVPWS